MARGTSTPYLNVTRIETAGCRGYQVKVTAACEEHQPYFPGLDDDALRSALLARNELWSLHQTCARGVLLVPMSPPEPSAHSSSGLRGIYLHTITERSGSQFDGIACRMRNLRTSRMTNRTWRLSQFRSDGAAMRHVRRELQANIKAYNAVVRLYNDLALRDALRIAAYEAIDLKPMLHLKARFDPERWSLALSVVHPQGLASTVAVNPTRTEA